MSHDRVDWDIANALRRNTCSLLGPEDAEQLGEDRPWLTVTNDYVSTNLLLSLAGRPPITIQGKGRNLARYRYAWAPATLSVAPIDDLSSVSSHDCLAPLPDEWPPEGYPAGLIGATLDDSEHWGAPGAASKFDATYGETKVVAAADSPAHALSAVCRGDARDLRSTKKYFLA